MRRSYQVACCAVVATMAGIWAAVAFSQNDDPFGAGDPVPLDVAAAAEAALSQPADTQPAATQPEPQAERSVLINQPTIQPTVEDTQNRVIADAEHDHLEAVHDHAHHAGNQSNDFCRCVGEADGAATARIRQALRGMLKSDGLEFQETPLEQVVDLIRAEYGIPILIDTVALDELGLSNEEPVTIHLRNISLNSALRLMLQRLGLTYTIVNEVLMITSPDEAEQQLQVCVYDVRDLRESTKFEKIDTLVDTIAACVTTETWAKNGGGEAEIRALGPTLLVISQTQAVHDEIRNLLSTIRATIAARDVALDTNNAAGGGGGFFRVTPE